MAGGNTTFEWKLKGDILSLPVAASQHIYRGGAVCIKGDGLAYPGDDLAGYQFVGIAEEEIDNSSGSSGAKNVRVRRHGMIWVTPVSQSVVVADIGWPCYLHTKLTGSQNQAFSRWAECKWDVCIGTIIAVDDYSSPTKWLVDLGNFSSLLPEVGLFSLQYGNGYGWPALIADASADISPYDWTVTAATAGSITAPDQERGGFNLVTGGSEDNGVQMQYNGECIQLTTGKLVQAKINMKLDDATQSDAFFGLAETDTTVLGHPDNVIGFETNDGDAHIDAVADNASGNTTETTGDDLSNNTAVVLGLVWEGNGYARFFNDGTYTHELNTTDDTIPTDVLMRPSLALLTGKSGAVTLTVSRLGFMAK